MRSQSGRPKWYEWYFSKGKDVISGTLMYFEDVDASLDEFEGIDHKRDFLK